MNDDTTPKQPDEGVDEATVKEVMKLLWGADESGEGGQPESSTPATEGKEETANLGPKPNIAKPKDWYQVPRIMAEGNIPLPEIEPTPENAREIALRVRAQLVIKAQAEEQKRQRSEEKKRAAQAKRNTPDAQRRAEVLASFRADHEQAQEQIARMVALSETAPIFAKAVADVSHGRILYDGKGYFCYRDGRWMPDTNGKLHTRRLVSEAIRGLLELARSTCERTRAQAESIARETSENIWTGNYFQKQLEAIEKNCKRLETRLTDIVNDLSLSRRIAPDLVEFEGHPRRLNCANAVVDLSTGGSGPHDPSFLFRHKVPVEYDASVDCPQFKQFLQEVFQGDEELISYVQKVLGYSITADTALDRFWVWYGGTRAGKGTLAHLVQKVLVLRDADHPEGLTVPVSYAFRRKGNELTKLNSLRDCEDARFVTYDEAEETEAWDEDTLKRFTGRDPLQARRAHQALSTFRNTAKLHVLTNVYAPFSDDAALWQRLRVIPFKAFFGGPNEVFKLENILFDAEQQGILAWLVEGASLALAEIDANAWSEPPAVVEATQAYRDARKVVTIPAKAVDPSEAQGFIDEWLVSEEGHAIPVDTIYRLYDLWCFLHGVLPVTSTKFSLRMKTHGYVNPHLAQGKHLKIAGRSRRAYDNIGVRPLGELEPFLEFLRDDEADQLSRRTGLTLAQAKHVLTVQIDLARGRVQDIVNETSAYEGFLEAEWRSYAHETEHPLSQSQWLEQNRQRLDGEWQSYRHDSETLEASLLSLVNALRHPGPDDDCRALYEALVTQSQILYP